MPGEPILTITDSDGISRTGYSYTVGAGGSTVMALLGDRLLPNRWVLTLRTSSACAATSKYLLMRRVLVPSPPLHWQPSTPRCGTFGGARPA